MTEAQLLLSTAKPGIDAPHYSLLVAQNGAEIEAAQRLRHRVFAEEMGATLRTPTPGLDVDGFDEFCDHLVVRDDSTGEIVGTYRMLPPERAAEAGRLYSETEFDISALAGLRGALVEAGRSCVHADHRSGAVVSLVWAGIARYMLLSGHAWLAGCASVPLHDGGELASGVWNTVRAKHYADERYRVVPLNPWDAESVAAPKRTVMPPLLKGYLRLGAWVCGPPALDADFGVADFFVLLGLEHIDRRYLKFFLGE
ncbi:MAG: GNAT family N-acetyltransferase [Actinomycetota bacterium]|nr:GNAT family N-acetyltransferase [Actinomycetota bacterium]